MQHIFGQVDFTTLYVSTASLHLLAAIDSFQDLAWVQLAVDQNTGVTLLNQKVDYLSAFLVPQYLEDLEDFLLEPCHVGDFFFQYI